jgi:purine-binding chemotaxis protein CheW
MTAASQLGVLPVCVFQLAGRSFALRLESIREIVPMAELSRPPLLPKLLEGFLNVGGTPIPVLRIADLLGLRQDPLELYTPLVITRNAARPLALWVKSVTGIFSVSQSAVAPLPAADSFNGCAESQLTVQDEPVYLLSLERLLLEKEQQAVAEFQAIEARRLHEG